MNGVLSALLSLSTPLYRAYYATLRVRGLVGEDQVVEPAEYPFGREIFALSERDALVLAGMIAHARFTALVTLGRDGDWASGLLERLGFGVVRGSSLHGGARALTCLIREMRRSDHPGAVVVDGPLGPVGQAKSGIVLCALRTGRPIRALGVAARHAIVFRKTWSQIFLPLPFTDVVIACDDPLPAPTSPRRRAIEELTRELTRRLSLVRRRALDAVGACAKANVGSGAETGDVVVASDVLPSRELAPRPEDAVRPAAGGCR